MGFRVYIPFGSNDMMSLLWVLWRAKWWGFPPADNDSEKDRKHAGWEQHHSVPDNHDKHRRGVCKNR